MGDIPRFEQLNAGMPVSLPIISREKFAQLIGLPIGVLIGQCEKGYWPQVHIGKRVFINLELVRKQCLAKEFCI